MPVCLERALPGHSQACIAATLFPWPCTLHSGLQFPKLYHFPSLVSYLPNPHPPIYSSPTLFSLLLNSLSIFHPFSILSSINHPFVHFLFNLSLYPFFAQPSHPTIILSREAVQPSHSRLHIPSAVLSNQQRPHLNIYLLD